MERVYLFFRPAARVSLFEALRDSGLVEVTTVPEAEAGHLLEGRTPGPGLSRSVSSVDARIALIGRLLEYLRPPGKFPPPRVPAGEVASLAAGVDLEGVAREVESLQKRENSLAALESALRKTRELLAGYSFFEGAPKHLSRPARRPGRAGMALLRLAGDSCPGFASALAGHDGFLAVLSRRRRELFVFAAWPASAGPAVARLIREHRAAEVELPPHRTAVPVTLVRLDRLARRNRSRRREAESRKDSLRRWLPALFALLEVSVQEREFLAAQDRAVASGRAAMLAGWIEKSRRRALLERVARLSPEVVVSVREPSRDEDVPVALRNGPLGKPFEAVGDLYGRTSYAGLDASPYLAFFFALTFAFCLADVGYGLMIVVLSLFLKRKFRSEPAGKMLTVFFYSGLATVLTGVLTNSWLGNFFRVFPFFPAGLPGFQERLALLSPVDNPADTMRFFYFALFFGFAQVSFGLMLKAAAAIRRAGPAGAASSLPPLACQLGIPLLAALFFLRGRLPFADAAIRVLVPVLAVSAALIVRHQFRLYRDIVERLFWAVYSLYGLVVGNLVADTLSYARIFALGLTSALLAVTVNELALMAGAVPLVGFLAAFLVLAAGHLFNLFISGLGSFVHTSRLQYLEFFTKFYEGGGRPFDPLRLEYRYLEVEGAS